MNIPKIFSNYLEKEFSIKYTAKSLGIFRFFFFISVLLLSGPMRLGSYYVSLPNGFFRPVGFLQLFENNPFNVETVLFIFTICQIALFFAAIGFLTKTSMFTAATLLVFHFTNTHSYRATIFLSIPLVIISCIFAMTNAGAAFSIDRWLFKKNIPPEEESFDFYWPFYIFRTYVSLTYTTSAITKLKIFGGSWFLEDQIQMFLLNPIFGQNEFFYPYFSHLRLNYFLGQFEVLCMVIAFLVLFLELFCWVGLFYKKLYTPILWSLYIFHLTSCVLFFVTPIPSMLALSCWLPWNRIANHLSIFFNWSNETSAS